MEIRKVFPGDVYVNGSTAAGDRLVTDTELAAASAPALGLPNNYMAGRYYYSVTGTPGTSSSLGNGTLLAVPLVLPSDSTIDVLGIEVNTGSASTTVRIGIYADNGGEPGSLILDAGSVACDTSGSKTITGLAQDLTAGVVWIATVTQNAAGTQPTVYTGTGTSQLFRVAVLGLTAAPTIGQASALGYYHSGTVSGALPATWTTANAITSAHRVIMKFI